MDRIDEQMNSLSKMEIPDGMHHGIMQRVNYQKVKPIFFIVFFLFVLNFLAIAWHINAKLIDADFLDMTRDFLDVFSFNFSFISTMFQNFFEIISPFFVLSATLSFVGAIYVGRKISIYRFGGI
jgi:hypothetical protein